MATLIGSSKKSDFKPKCAYFESRVILKDEEIGTQGQEVGVCRNKNLLQSC